MGAAHAPEKDFQVRRTAAAYKNGGRIVMLKDAQAERCLLRQLLLRQSGGTAIAAVVRYRADGVDSWPPDGRSP